MDYTDNSFLDHIPCGVFYFNGEGVIEYANAFFLQQVKYAHEELIGQHVEKILTVSTRIFYQTHFFPLLTLQGAVNEIFLTLLSKDKSPVPVLVNASRQQLDWAIKNICVCLTVSQRKKYEDEILEAKRIAEDALHKNELLKNIQSELEQGKQELDKQITQLKYTNEELLQLNELVTHDLQEPLRKISLYTDRIVTNQQNVYDEKTIASLTIITKSVNRIRTLLQSLQNYLPIITEPLKITKVELNNIVNDSLIIAKQNNGEIPIDVTVEKLPVIQGDPKQLKLLFRELFTNSIKFRNLERNLWITIKSALVQENIYNSTEGKYKYVDFVRIVFEDNGQGFNTIYKDLIFKILKRLHLKSEGLGFGLSVCKRIVENHRGSIKASGEEGKGAKISILLPVA